MRIWVAAAALALVVGAGHTAPTPNVRGVVVAPQRLGCPPDEPCDPPPLGVYVVFVRARHLPVRVRVQLSGRFAVYLPPARYTIRLAPPPLGGTVVPATVLVPRGRAITLRITVKTVTA